MELNPFDGNLRNTYAVACYRAGDFAAAAREFEASDELAPGRYTAMNAYFLAMAHHRMGEFDVAHRWFRAANAWQRKQNVADWNRFQNEAANVLGIAAAADLVSVDAGGNEIDLLGLLLEANPDAAWAYVRRAVLWDQQGETEKAAEDRQQAARCFDQLIAYAPGEVYPYAARAVFREQNSETTGAIADWTEIIERRPDLASIWMRRGGLLAQLERYDEAANDFAEAVELDAKFFRPRYLLALTQLCIGDMPGYQHTCAAMVDTFLETDDMIEAKFTSWSCVLGTEAVDSYANVTRLAEKSVSMERKLKLGTLGAALYRAGRYDEALARLNQAEVLNSLTETSTDTSPAYRWYFLAMTHHCLGNTEKSRAFLHRALERTEQALASPPELEGGNWFRLATLRLLRDEAQSLTKNEQSVRTGNLLAK